MVPGTLWRYSPRPKNIHDQGSRGRAPGRRGGEISADAAAMAHADLLDLRVELFPYSPFAARYGH